MSWWREVSMTLTNHHSTAQAHPWSGRSCTLPNTTWSASWHATLQVLEFQKAAVCLNMLLSTSMVGMGNCYSPMHRSPFSLFHLTEAPLLLFAMFKCMHPNCLSLIGALWSLPATRSLILSYITIHIPFVPGPDAGNLSATTKSCENQSELV